jgi:3-phosphoshikimate 1-carboxyvinyltransferase
LSTFPYAAIVETIAGVGPYAGVVETIAGVGRRLPRMAAMRRRRAPVHAPLRGAVEVPGDKSISHRALILAALGEGRARVTGLNPGDDVRATADALRALGVALAEGGDDTEAVVDGKGWGGLREADDVVDARNSGTTIRLGAGLCAGVPCATVLTGDATLRRRPMLRVVAPLRQMGAAIDGARHGDRPPLFVRGGDLRGIDLELPVPSAQVKTCILLAGLAATGRTSVTEPARSRDHTERMLAAAGAAVDVAGLTTTVDGGQRLSAIDWEIPGDVSAAAFFVVAATLVEGSDVTIERVGLNPTRAAYLDVLRAMGADVEVDVEGESGGEPFGSIRVRHAALRATEIAGDVVATLLDEVPALAIAASQAEGTTTIRGARELRVKESDRVAAIASGLRALGVSVEELPDGLVIEGPASVTGGRIDSHGDHRIAMAFAVAGLVADGNVVVDGWSCVDTSFPGFLDVLGRAQGRLA